MDASEVILKPFLAVFPNQPNMIYPTRPDIFIESSGSTPMQLNKKRVGSKFVTREGKIFELTAIYARPYSDDFVLSEFLRKRYLLHVDVKPLDWSFQDIRKFLHLKIGAEMESCDHMLNTLESRDTVLEKISKASDVSKIFDIIVMSPSEECLGAF